jgi:hypothetical protein
MTSCVILMILLLFVALLRYNVIIEEETVLSDGSS